MNLVFSDERIREMLREQYSVKKEHYEVFLKQELPQEYEKLLNPSDEDIQAERERVEKIREDDELARQEYYLPYTTDENGNEITPVFIKKLFTERAERYRFVGIRLLGEFVDPAPFSPPKPRPSLGGITNKEDVDLHPDSNSDQNTLHDGITEGEALDEAVALLMDQQSCREYADILFSYDTPPLLDSECSVLANLFVEHCFYGVESDFDTDIESMHDPSVGLYSSYGENYLDSCSIRVYLKSLHFTKTGIVSEFVKTEIDIPYVAGPDCLYVVIFCENGHDRVFWNVSDFGNVSEYGSGCIDKLGYCQGLVLHNRSEILKAALHETDIEKRNRRFYEEQEKGRLTNPEIGALVAKELGEEPYSEGTVRRGADEHRKKYCSAIPAKRRRPGRPKKRTL